MKKRIISFALAAVLAATSGVVSISAAKAETTAAAETAPLSIKDAIPAGNLLGATDFNGDALPDIVKGPGVKIGLEKDTNGGYLSVTDITVNYQGPVITPKTAIPAGNYKFTGYFRTKYAGELTVLRLIFSADTSITVNVYPKSSEWLKVETYVTLNGALKNIKVCGGTNPEYYQAYCLDNFSLEKVDSIPAGGDVKSFGTPINGAKALESTTVSKLAEAPAKEPAAPAAPTTPEAPVAPTTPAVSGDATAGAPLSVKDALPDGNLFADGAFNNEDTLKNWNAMKQKLELIKDANGGYLMASGIELNHTGFIYKPATDIPAGNYKLTGYFRTAYAGELTHLRINITDSSSTSIVHVYPKSNEWTKVETYITLNSNLKDIKICGGPSANYYQAYCMDNFSLVKVDSVPANNATTFGVQTTPAAALASSKYSVQASSEPAASTTPAESVKIDTSVMVDVPEELPAANILKGSDFDEPGCLSSWKKNSQVMNFEQDGTNGFITFSGITVNYAGFTYTPTVTVGAGAYKFIGYFRTAAPGALTHLRVHFTDSAKSHIVHVYPTSDKWIKVETYINVTGTLQNIKVSGGPNADFVQPYSVDNFSLEKVSAVPDGGSVTTFGTPVGGAAAKASYTAPEVVYDLYDPNEDYEIQGVIINQDADGFIGGIAIESVTVDTLIDYAKQFGGSHVTDYMITLNNTNATFRSPTWTDILDKYYQKEENGQPVDYSGISQTKGAYRMYEILKTDYIDLWCKAFPEVGINPWLSFRMNDAHDLGQTTSWLLSDYFHEHPEIRRVQHGVKSNTYYNNCQDYSYKLVRDHMLDLINDALNLYDPYGIEIDWQREIWLWHTGGEYAGYDILNGFMRDVRDLVAVYEQKYGHEIKISVRVAPTIEANYDFGLDIVTWASEGIIDMVTPMGRWSSTHNDTPVRLWKSVLEPYGVILAPGIETNIQNPGTGKTGSHTLETFSAAAASYLSQGADKIYYFNYYNGATFKITEKDRINTTDPSVGITSAKGYFNVISTTGSYDKLMTRDRKLIMTYNDTNQLWSNGDKQLPRTVMVGRTAVLRMPLGDVPTGSEVLFKFTTNVNYTEKTANVPAVSINGYPAAFKSIEWAGEYSENNVLVYTVPTEAHGDTYLLAEIVPKDYLTIDYCEVYVKAPDGEAVVVKPENIPSDWATPEVDAAVAADIVPALLKKQYREKITREEFCTLIMKMINKANDVSDSKALLTKLGKTYTDSFNDTDNADVIAANLIGIVNGRGEGIFDPRSGITRQEAAIMLANAAKVLEIGAGTAPEFADMDKAASWAADYIKYTASIVSSTGKNVMGGVGDNMFDPLGSYTREQSILTVYRLFMSK